MERLFLKRNEGVLWQVTGGHQREVEKGQSQPQLAMKIASFDGSLGQSVLLQNYIQVYERCVFFIAPVFLQALDVSVITRELANVEEASHSESDNVILFNFYVAVALGM